MNLRTFRPAYLARRIGQARFQRRHPDAPWLTPAAILLLDAWLRPTDRGLEWGSGRSTAWLARHGAELTSIEHDAAWHAQVRERLAAAGVAQRVAYHLIACERAEVEADDGHPYVQAAAGIEAGTLDFVLVDGLLRVSCMPLAMQKLRPGGLLILDNANRYVPNRIWDGSQSTVHEPRTSPRPGWEPLLAELAAWRAILTSDGIWDTRFWVKPG